MVADIFVFVKRGYEVGSLLLCGLFCWTGEVRAEKRDVVSI